MLSRYVYRIKLNNNHYLLYNALNKCLIEVDNLDEEEWRKDTYINSFMISNNFIIKKWGDDLTLKEEYLLTYKYSSDYISYVIHTNYTCNFNCSYCYQGIINETFLMNESIATKVLAEIKYRCRKEKPTVLDVCLIGGEPLLNFQIVKYIADGLKHITCRYKKISLVTNGYYLTLDNYEILSQYGICLFQVTIDGNSDTHNRKRKGKGGEDTFSVIINNLKAICRKYKKNKIVINYNLDIETFLSVEVFFDLLRRNNITCKVIFSEVFDPKNVNSGKLVSARSQIWYKAHTIAIDYGQRYAPFYRMSYLACGIRRVNNIMINPKGVMYKCISGMEDEEYYIGEIGDGKEYIKEINISKFVEGSYQLICQDCEYFPVCGGGCIYRNRIHGFSCWREEIELNDIPLIKYQYELDVKNM